MEQEDLYPIRIVLTNNSEFVIYTNVPQEDALLDESNNSLNAVLEYWLAHTDLHTARSFVDCINSKGYHYAITRKEYNKRKYRKLAFNNS